MWKWDLKLAFFSLSPSTNTFWALLSFQSRNKNFCARSSKSRDYAEAYCRTPHKWSRRLVRLWRIDADLSRDRRGIAEKGHLWMETSLVLISRIILSLPSHELGDNSQIIQAILWKGLWPFIPRLCSSPCPGVHWIFFRLHLSPFNSLFGRFSGRSIKVLFFSILLTGAVRAFTWASFKTPPFARSLRQTTILILEISNIFLW